MNFPLALIFSLLSVSGYGLTSLLLGKAAGRLGAFWTSFLVQLLGLALTLLFVPFFGLQLTPDAHLLPLAIFGASVVFVFTLYSKNLSIGPVSVVQSMLRLSNLLIFVLAVLFLHERITLIEIMSVLVMLVGVVLVSFDVRQLVRKRVQTLTRAMPTVLIQIVLQSVGVLFLGFGIRQFGGFSANVGGRLFTVPLFMFLSVTQWRKKPTMTLSSWKLILLITALDVVSYLFYTSAVQLYELSFTSMVQSTMPIVTAVLGFLFFGERLTRTQKLGIMIAVLGTMGLGSGR